MTILEIWDMYLIVYVIFSKLFILSQYLVTYVVPGIKGLPGRGDLVFHAAWAPLGHYYGMQSILFHGCH